MTADALRRLKELGRDLGTIPISKLPATFNRVCFICCNNYTRPDYSLGVGPISDALTVAKAAKFAGLEMYFLNNPRKNTFLEYFDKFLSSTQSALFFFYVGHGTQVKCTTGDEADGYDECFVFDDAFLVDDDLADHLIKNKHNESTTVLITDACHSGSIWDLTDKNRRFPHRIISLSAAADNQTAKQLMIERIEQGAFTYNMYSMLKDNILVTPRQLQPKLNTILKQYQQALTIETTSPEMLDEPLFQPAPHEYYDEEEEPVPAPVSKPAETKPPVSTTTSQPAETKPPTSTTTSKPAETKPPTSTTTSKPAETKPPASSTSKPGATSSSKPSTTGKTSSSKPTTTGKTGTTSSSKTSTTGKLGTTTSSKTPAKKGKGRRKTKKPIVKEGEHVIITLFDDQEIATVHGSGTTSKFSKHPDEVGFNYISTIDKPKSYYYQTSLEYGQWFREQPKVQSPPYDGKGIHPVKYAETWRDVNKSGNVSEILDPERAVAVNLSKTRGKK